MNSRNNYQSPTRTKIKIKMVCFAVKLVQFGVDITKENPDPDRRVHHLVHDEALRHSIVMVHDHVLVVLRKTKRFNIDVARMA
jgi:hypothetical protein